MKRPYSLGSPLEFGQLPSFTSSTTSLALSTSSSSSSSISSGLSSGASTPGDLHSGFTTQSNSVFFLPVRNQTILLVGGLGYIGSHTAWEFLKVGYDVVIVDNLVNAHQSVMDNLHGLLDDHYAGQDFRPTLELCTTDYRDEAAMRKLLEEHALPSTSPSEPTSRIHGVIHFAAYKSVSGSIKVPLSYYANNVCGLVNLCELLGSYGVKNLVFSSSATVYGDLAADKSANGRIPEEQCTHSPRDWTDAVGTQRRTHGGCEGLTNPYGRSKWMCEAILHDLAVSDPEWTITALRYFNPVGCDPSGRLGEQPKSESTGLFPAITRVVTGKQASFHVFGRDWDTPDGTALRDFIHVSDLARGHVAAFTSTVTPGCDRENASPAAGHVDNFRAYNLGTGHGHSVGEVIATMELASGLAIPTVYSGRREGDVGVCIAEPSRAMQELNWRAERSLEDCCRDVCRFLGIGEVASKKVPSVITATSDSFFSRARSVSCV